MRIIEMTICEKTATVLEMFHRKNIIDEFQILNIWLSSETFNSIIEGDVALCSQAKSYIIREFIKELNYSENINLQNNILSDSVFYWIGYLMTYWCFEYNIMPSDIVKNYDLESILYSYSTLHTLSIKASIEKIMEDYYIGKN